MELSEKDAAKIIKDVDRKESYKFWGKISEKDIAELKERFTEKGIRVKIFSEGKQTRIEILERTSNKKGKKPAGPKSESKPPTKSRAEPKDLPFNEEKPPGWEIKIDDEEYSRAEFLKWTREPKEETSREAQRAKEDFDMLEFLEGKGLEQQITSLHKENPLESDYIILDRALTSIFSELGYNHPVMKKIQDIMINNRESEGVQKVFARANEIRANIRASNAAQLEQPVAAPIEPENQPRKKRKYVRTSPEAIQERLVASMPENPFKHLQKQGFIEQFLNAHREARDKPIEEKFHTALEKLHKAIHETSGERTRTLLIPKNHKIKLAVINARGHKAIQEMFQKLQEIIDEHDKSNPPEEQQKKEIPAPVEDEKMTEPQRKPEQYFTKDSIKEYLTQLKNDHGIDFFELGADIASKDGAPSGRFEIARMTIKKMREKLADRANAEESADKLEKFESQLTSKWNGYGDEFNPLYQAFNLNIKKALKGRLSPMERVRDDLSILDEETRERIIELAHPEEESFQKLIAVRKHAMESLEHAKDLKIAHDEEPYHQVIETLNKKISEHPAFKWNKEKMAKWIGAKRFPFTPRHADELAEQLKTEGLGQAKYAEASLSDLREHADVQRKLIKQLEAIGHPREEIAPIKKNLAEMNRHIDYRELKEHSRKARAKR